MSGPATDGEAEPRTLLTRVRRVAPFALVFLIALFLVTLNVRSPFQGTHEGNGVVFTGIAANHIRLGLDDTKGQDVFSATEYGIFPNRQEIPDIFERFFDGETTARKYGHHPPLLGLSVAAAISVGGQRYTVVRSVPILFALAGLVLFYLLIRKVFDPGVAAVASLLYATFPIFAYYGRNVCHESPTLCFGLAMLLGYVYWRDTGGTRWAVMVAASTVLGGLYGWPMYYAAALLVAADWIQRRRFDWRLFSLTVVPAIVTGLLVIAQIAWLYGGDLGSLSRVLDQRSGGGGFTASAWVLRMVNVYGPNGFGTLVTLTALPVLFFLALRLKQEGFSQRLMLVAFFGSWGLAHLLLFREGAWVHEYWMFYLIPFFALAIGWMACEAARTLTASAWLRSAAFLAMPFVLWYWNSERIYALFNNTNAGPQGVYSLFTMW